jgi:hypothetical protein
VRSPLLAPPREPASQPASDHYRQELRLAHRTAELDALTGLGRIHRRQGMYGQASDHYHGLLDLVHRCSNRNYQFEAWHGLGVPST